MAFRVEPEAVRTAAGKYEDSGEHLAAAADYHGRYVDFGLLGTGFIVAMNDDHHAFQRLLSDRLANAVQALTGSARELTMAAQAYTATDAATAGKLDATYPAVERNSVPAPFGGR
ncbi:type VII secretion target [Catellatospora vulcania]|uniref:type VII secretion target n=1 Tax=Catellatospora vulcania TaxID=1460450 RepID=UPI0012D49989|nr:type VII secretion target [Catellatospora vulcania]